MYLQSNIYTLLTCAAFASKHLLSESVSTVSIKAKETPNKVTCQRPAARAIGIKIHDVNASHRPTPVYHSRNTLKACVFRKLPIKTQLSRLNIHSCTNAKKTTVFQRLKNHKVLLVCTIRPQNETSVINTIIEIWRRQLLACHSDN